MRTAKQRGLQIFFNAAPFDANISTYPMDCVDILCVNEVEASALAGVNTFEVETVLGILHEKYSHTKLLLTAGSQGSYYFEGQEKLYTPCSNVRAIDTTAAGDTYSGYFLAGICKGDTVEEAMKLATKAAGIAVQRKGAASSIPSIAELGMRK